MDRPRSLGDDEELVGVHRRDVGGVEPVAQPVAQERRRHERPLHRHLLVEQHPEQDGERVGVEELVGVGVAGDGKHGLHAPEPT